MKYKEQNPKDMPEKRQGKPSKEWKQARENKRQY